MLAARIHGPKDLRVGTMPEPMSPQEGEVLLRIKAVGICGSDLHMYESGNTGAGIPTPPLVIGHEFMGEVLAVGPNAHDGLHQPLRPGQRVAVEPTVPCYKCERCEQGDINLCPNHTFYGLSPTDGAMREQMIVVSRNCFPIPDSITDGAGTLLETLGVAIHTVDLAKIKVGNSVAIIGCGPVGLLILRMAKLAGADPIYCFDCFPWRAEKARDWGTTHAWIPDDGDPANLITEHTGGRGVDVVFEAAWADHSVQMATEMARYGGRVMLVGIPVQDTLQIQPSISRRKGLDLRYVRRMKHTYPRAIHLATGKPPSVPLDDLISHHFAIAEASKAFAMNLAYEKGVHKVIIDV